MANAADTPRSDAASHDFDVEAVLLERERRGLRIPAMARVLFTSYAVLAILSAAPGDVRAIGLTIVGVVLNATTGRAFRGNAYYSNRYPYRYGYGQSEDGDDAEDQGETEA